MIDILPWLEKLCKLNKSLKGNQAKKQVKEMCEKEYGDKGEFLQLFDMVIDVS